MKTFFLFAIAISTALFQNNALSAEVSEALWMDNATVVGTRDIANNEIYGVRVTEDALREVRQRLVRRISADEELPLNFTRVTLEPVDAS